jgi:hypothetical protein
MISLPLNDNRDLPSHLCSALAGRRINLDGGKANNVHLYTALATRWRNVARCAARLLSDLRRLQAAPASESQLDDTEIIASLTAFIYASTEALDLYHQTLPSRLEDKRTKSEVKSIRAYQGSVKRFRDPIAQICNSMKHEHRSILAARLVSIASGQVVFVYRINTVRNGVQVPDARVHKGEGFASFERTLHEILHALLRTDHLAGELVSTLSDNNQVAIDLKGSQNLGLADILADLGRRRPIVALAEPGRFDGIEIHGSAVSLARVTADKLPEPTRRTVRFTVDEVARRVDLFS